MLAKYDSWSSIVARVSGDVVPMGISKSWKISNMRYKRVDANANRTIVHNFFATTANLVR